MKRWLLTMRAKKWIDLPWRVAVAWQEDHLASMAASLSYYTLFSLAPLLLIVLGALGLFVDRNTLNHHFLAEITQLLGEKSAGAIQVVLEHATLPGNGGITIAIGFGILIFAATGVFVELKRSLNIIWRVAAPEGGGIWAIIRRYFAPMSMIVGIGFLLLVSLLLSAGLAAVSTYFGERYPAAVFILRGLDQIFAIGLVTGLFAMIYKVLPDRELSWRDVWFGATVGAILFVIGRAVIGVYLGRATITTSYGPAGSLVAILAWVYYSAQIMMIGAECARIRREYLRGEYRTSRDAPPISSMSSPTRTASSTAKSSDSDSDQNPAQPHAQLGKNEGTTANVHQAGNDRVQTCNVQEKPHKAAPAVRYDGCSVSQDRPPQP